MHSVSCVSILVLLLTTAEARKAAVALDERGNVHVNTTDANAKVFVNGIDVLARLGDVPGLQQSLEKLSDEDVPGLKQRLDMVFNAIFGPPLTIETLDSQGSVGFDTSLALVPGTNAPVMSYYDGTNGDLKICICSDSLCSSKTIKTLDSEGRVGDFTSLALAPGTNAPVISYRDYTNRDLKICICSDSVCSSTTIKILDSEGNFGWHTSLALAPGTNAPVISYRDLTNDDLKICICSDSVCTNTTIKTLDFEGNVGLWISLALVPGTNAPVISYRDFTTDYLKICICSNALCSSKLIKILEGNVGSHTSLALVAGTNAPVISYEDFTNDDLKICICSDSVCSSTTIKTLDSQGQVGRWTSLALVPATNAPVISYLDDTNYDLKICICSDSVCSSSTIKTLDSEGSVGESTSLALVPGTNAPVISYFDRTNLDLKIVICGTPTCD